MQGDELIATSGITYTTEQQYGETRVKGGEQVIRLLARGEVLARDHFPAWLGRATLGAARSTRSSSAEHRATLYWRTYCCLRDHVCNDS